jgi:hypothetical protein
VDPQPDPAVSIGREIVASVERRDWSRLAACLSGDVVFRAVIPNQRRPFREHIGPDAAVAQVARWFDDGDIHELLDSSVDMVADRLHVRYRVRNREVGQWYLVEQHLFATLSGARITSLDLLCSGFRDIPSTD